MAILVWKLLLSLLASHLQPVHDYSFSTHELPLILRASAQNFSHSLFALQVRAEKAIRMPAVMVACVYLFTNVTPI